MKNKYHLDSSTKGVDCLICRPWATNPPRSLVEDRYLIDNVRLKLTGHPFVLSYGMISFKALRGDGIPSHLFAVEVVDGFLDRLKSEGGCCFRSHITTSTCGSS